MVSATSAAAGESTNVSSTSSAALWGESARGRPRRSFLFGDFFGDPFFGDPRPFLFGEAFFLHFTSPLFISVFRMHFKCFMFAGVNSTHKSLDLTPHSTLTCRSGHSPHCGKGMLITGLTNASCEDLIFLFFTCGVSSVSISSTSSASCAHLIDVSRRACRSLLKEGRLQETGSLLPLVHVVNMFFSRVNITNPLSNLEHFAKHVSIFWMHVGIHGFPLAPSWTTWRRVTWTPQASPASSPDSESGPRCLDMAQTDTASVGRPAVV